MVTAAMKFRTIVIPLLAGLLPAVTADFDIYYVRDQNYARLPGDPNGGEVVVEGYTILQNDPTKDEVQHSKLFRKKDDVSGIKTGVRCKGKNCFLHENPEAILQLEMNFGNGWHWSECSQFF
jgi:hypothetical protein